MNDNWSAENFQKEFDEAAACAGKPKNNMRFYLPFMIARKASSLLLSHGFVLHSDDEKIDLFFSKMQTHQNLELVFANNEYQLSTYGRLVCYAEKIDGNWYLQQSNSTYPINVQFNNNVPITTQFFITNRNTLANNLVQLVTIDKKGISKSKAFSTSAEAIGFMGEHVESKGKVTSTEGVWEYLINLNMPPNLFLTEIGYAPRDTYAIEPDLYDDIQCAYDAVLEDISISQNKIITTGDLKINPDTQARQRRIISNQILKTSNASILGGTEVNVDFLKAEPNSATLYEAFQNLIDFAVTLCGYSAQHQGSKYSTSTEQHYNREQDIQTTEIKRKLRNFSYRHLFGQILIKEGLWDGNGQYPFIFEFNDLITHDKMQSLERLIKEVDNGFRTKANAVQMLRGLSNKNDAVKILEEAKKEREEFAELYPDAGGDTSQNQQSALENPKGKTQDKQTRKTSVVKK